MNSVAGNKERLAVSTRGKKYGVSCDGYKAETGLQTRVGQGTPFLGTMRRCRAAPSSPPAAEAPPLGVRARRRVCPRVLPHTRLALGIFSVLLCLPFPAPLTFAAFMHLKGELCRKGRFSMNSLPFLEILSLYLQDPEGCTLNE